jgi:hypothetical protein
MQPGELFSACEFENITIFDYLTKKKFILSFFSNCIFFEVGKLYSVQYRKIGEEAILYPQTFYLTFGVDSIREKLERIYG